MIRRKKRTVPPKETQVTESQVTELQRLLNAPSPFEVIRQMPEPVVRSLLLHFVNERRYGSE